MCRGDVVAEVTKLKQEEGRDLLIWGHGLLAETLLKQHLVDVLDISIYPVVAGARQAVLPGRPERQSEPRHDQDLLERDREAHLRAEALAEQDPDDVGGPVQVGFLAGDELGAFFRHEVATQLGLDFHIGLPEADEARVARVIPQAPDPQNLSPMEQAAFTDPTSIPYFMLVNCGGYMLPGEADSRAAHAAELPSTGGITNARGLAAMYQPLAEGGAPLVSEGTVRRMTAVASAATDAVILLPTRWTQGFVKAVDNRRFGPGQSVIYAEEAFGHPGSAARSGSPIPRRGCRSAMS